MTQGQQPEALRLAEQYDYGDPAAHSNTWKAAVCNELRRQHTRIAELEAQLSSSGFTAADMAAAEARGFRDGVASVAASAGEPVAHLWQHCETGRTRIVMPDMIVDADASWQVVGPLYLGAAPPTAQAEGWRPIETAPKDGRTLLLGYYNRAKRLHDAALAAQREVKP